VSKGKTHYASYEAPHEGDNCEYWGDPICGKQSDDLTNEEDAVTCKDCVRIILQSDRYKKILNLLLKAGFEQTEEASRDFANQYCCICLDYQKKGETVIVNNTGGIMEQLPTNYYAILGWLLKSRMGSIKLLDL
jgi:hypothetical protein